MASWAGGVDPTMDRREQRRADHDMRIVITGALGFIGWHCRAYFQPMSEVSVEPVGRVEFATDRALDEALDGCDAVIHLAGVNRGDEEAVWRANIALAERLTQRLTATDARPHVVFANSTQACRDTRYGDSKRRAADIIREWANRAGARFTDLVIPHVFGECGRPFYNSAVATFCHQLAHGETPRIIEDGVLELVHARAVAEASLAAIRSGHAGEQRLTGVRIRVSEVLAQLTTMDRQYRSQVIPPLATPFELDLFNAYRAARFPQGYPIAIPLRADTRGELFEAVRTLRGGQCFVSTTRPGITRGNHYHRRKIERFLVLRGEALIRVRRLLHRDVTEYPVSGARPGFVDMPCLHTHNITNVGQDDLVTLFWSHEIFDPEAPDTFTEPV